MSSIAGTAQQQLQQRAAPQLLEATVLDPAVSGEGFLRVEVDAQPGVVQECPYARWGGMTPLPGDAAAVMFSDGGHYWAMWWPQNAQVGAASGPAGGDLAGSYPNPTVRKASGAFSAGGDVAVTGKLTTTGDVVVGGKLQIPTVSALPASPVDGQECVYVADATARVLWLLRYNAASSSPYKWEFLGGSPLYNGVYDAGASFNTSPTAYAVLAFPAPTLVIPLAGDYTIDSSFGGFVGQPVNDFRLWAEPDVANAVAFPYGFMSAEVAGRGYSTRSIGRFTAVPAGNTVRYRHASVYASFPFVSYSRQMYVTPTRVG